DLIQGHLSSFVQQPNGRLLGSSALGLYALDQGDSSWTKKYPLNGYLGNITLTNDKLGNIYLYDPSIPYNINAQATPLVMSTDNGNTWSPDSAGESAIAPSIFFADENGTEHFGNFQYGSFYLCKMWAKPSGGSWTLDTVGFPVANYS